MDRSKAWVGPLMGVIFVVLFAVVFVLLGEGQDATKKSAEDIQSYYQDHESKEFIASIVIGYASISLLFFAGYLRRVLRDAEGSSGTLSAVAFAGAIIFAGGAIVSASLHLALSDLADETDVVDPVVLQTINAIDWDNFLFFPVGLGTLVLASGISVVRHGALPKWLGWLGVVVGILSYTPAFPATFIGAPLFILITSIILLMRSRSGGTAAAPAA
jgi:Domain of unknown function (DUF4386)